MRKSIQQHILLERLKGNTDPAIAFALLMQEQLHASERKALEDMLLEDFVLSTKYYSMRKQYWPEYELAARYANEPSVEQGTDVKVIIQAMINISKNKNNEQAKDKGR
ncbi:hypothetical protein [Zoogloea sp.]|uniref:hypothetical protein n=1 Tax=Zoogloea sp. TaxID=49181 RepID=UPI0014166348|nr:MAG: hypothetical protein F9K15_02360 [Zoogloea sp.]